MIFQYTKTAKEIKEEKRKSTKRDSFLESKSQNSLFILEEKSLATPSATSLNNLEDNYFKINKAVNKQINSLAHQSQLLSVNKTNLESSSDHAENNNELDQNNIEESYGVDKDTFYNTKINKGVAFTTLEASDPKTPISSKEYLEISYQNSRRSSNSEKSNNLQKNDSITFLKGSSFSNLMSGDNKNLEITTPNIENPIIISNNTYYNSKTNNISIAEIVNGSKEDTEGIIKNKNNKKKELSYIESLNGLKANDDYVDEMEKENEKFFNNLEISNKGKSEAQDNIENEIVESEDFIEYKGQKIFKPFVEKPVNGDDHNIYIYYPPSLGGGQKRLFRKTKKLSSLFITHENNIRRDKSYIYEEFLQTDGFDIKVYTIGPEYAHAEARKAPSLDGVVKRSAEGKEVRYPVNLTPYEKEISRKIVNIFKQNICGFDILRSKGKSYVCDVNGWSFVKGNRKYYEDCVVLIRKMILMNLDPQKYEKKPLSLQIHVPTYEELILPHWPKPQDQKFEEELRSVVSIFRHGDRSPKQKMKFVTNEKKILNLYEKYANKSLKEIKLKKPKQLMEVLNLTQELLSDYNITYEDSFIGVNDTLVNKLFQLKMVMEKNINFEGMTRKVIFLY